MGVFRLIRNNLIRGNEAIDITKFDEQIVLLLNDGLLPFNSNKVALFGKGATKIFSYGPLGLKENIYNLFNINGIKVVNKSNNKIEASSKTTTAVYVIDRSEEKSFYLLEEEKEELAIINSLYSDVLVLILNNVVDVKEIEAKAIIYIENACKEVFVELTKILLNETNFCGKLSFV